MNAVKQQHNLTATSILTTKSTYQSQSAQQLSECTVYIYIYIYTYTYICTYIHTYTYIVGVQIFQKYRSHFRILGARRVT
jgi:hypothetical protein